MDYPEFPGQALIFYRLQPVAGSGKIQETQGSFGIFGAFLFKIGDLVRHILFLLSFI